MTAAGPTRHLSGHHLTPFTDPKPVASTLVELASLLATQAETAHPD